MSPTNWIILVVLLAVSIGCVGWQIWRSNRSDGLADRIKQDCAEAALLAHQHMMQAEYHASLAEMYEGRADRLRGEVQSAPATPLSIWGGKTSDEISQDIQRELDKVK